MGIPAFAHKPEALVLLNVFRRIACGLQAERLSRAMTSNEYKNWMQHCNLYSNTLQTMLLIPMFNPDYCGTSFKESVVNLIHQVINLQQKLPSSFEQIKGHQFPLKAEPLQSSVGTIEESECEVIEGLFSNIGRVLKKRLLLSQSVAEMQNNLNDLESYGHVLQMLLIFPKFTLTFKEATLRMFTATINTLNEFRRGSSSDTTQAQTQPVPFTPPILNSKPLGLSCTELTIGSIANCDIKYTPLKKHTAINIASDDEDDNFVEKVRCELRQQGVTDCDLNLDGINLPVTLEQIHKFEMNNNLAIDVFRNAECGKTTNRSKERLLRLSNNVAEGVRRIDLFLSENELPSRQKNEPRTTRRRLRNISANPGSDQNVDEDCRGPDERLSISEDEPSSDSIDHETPEAMLEPTLSATWSLASILTKLFSKSGGDKILKVIFFFAILINAGIILSKSHVDREK